MSDKWECVRCDFVGKNFNELWQHYDDRHRQLMFEEGRRFRALTPELQYHSINARRVQQIKEIQQFKVDAESWNENVRKPDEEPIGTSWCDEFLQKVLEMIPRKPR